MMSERITARLDDEVYSRLSDAAKARGLDISSVARQAVIAYLEGASETVPTFVPLHRPEDCLAVVVSHASPRAQRRLAETLTRIDGPSRARDARGCGLWRRPWPSGRQKRNGESLKLPCSAQEGAVRHAQVTMRGHDEVRACLSDAARRRRMDRFTWIRQASLGALRGLVTPTPRPIPRMTLKPAQVRC